jgi:undecaprenyl-diphosphatase
MDQVIPSARYSLARLDAAELSVVRGFALTARPRAIRAIAIALSWLGNGWVYVAIGIGGVIAGGLRALPALATGAFNAGVLHCLYPWIKRRFARPRPYQRDPTLAPLLKPLDEYSFPSGHSMTLTAALVPLVVAFPQITGAACILWALMGWARLASAHHYPSDVAAGTLLGIFVSYPVSIYALVALRLVG